MVKAYEPSRSHDETPLRTQPIEAEEDASAAPDLDIEHDVYIRRYPHEFTRIPATIRYLGPGKPRVVIDRVTDDE